MLGWRGSGGPHTAGAADPRGLQGGVPPHTRGSMKAFQSPNKLELSNLGIVCERPHQVLTLLRLLRAAKFKAVRSLATLGTASAEYGRASTSAKRPRSSKVMGAFENRLAKRGNITFVYWSTIIQSIASVLVVNHTLACAIFYIGAEPQTLSHPKPKPHVQFSVN